MLNVDLRIKRIEPKLGDIISVVEEDFTTIAKTIPYEGGTCQGCAFYDRSNVDLDCSYFVRCVKNRVMFKLIERKRTKEVKKMNRISLSDRDRFVPKEGEVFLQKFRERE